jgi:hypothetical protein
LTGFSRRNVGAIGQKKNAVSTTRLTPKPVVVRIAERVRISTKCSDLVIESSTSVPLAVTKTTEAFAHGRDVREDIEEA